MSASARVLPISASPSSTTIQTQQLNTDQISILDFGTHKSNFLPALLPIGGINVLSQMRKTFDEIRGLANSIAELDIINALTVARFTPEECNEYLDATNAAWGTKKTLNDLRITRTQEGLFYFVLIAGERRFRAFQALWYEGCDSCQEEFAPKGVPEGICYRRHFGDRRVDVRIRLNATSSLVLTTQLAENTYKAPPPHEEARAYAEYYRVWKVLNPAGTLVKFSQMGNRSVDTLRDYFRYYDLPDFVKLEVVCKTISFGIALELSRLQMDGEAEDQLESWLRKAYVADIPVPAFRDLITEYLKQKHSGQTSMWDMMQTGAQEEVARQERRLVVEARVNRDLHRSIGYRRRVIDLLRSGKLGLEDSPYSSASSVALFLKEVEVAIEEMELLREVALLTPAKYAVAQEVLSERACVLQIVSARIEPQTSSVIS